jgi:hypothetical protein
MNIVDAFNSNQRVRRSVWVNSPFKFKDAYIGELTYDDISAPDWEIEESAVRLTEEAFHNAWWESISEIRKSKESAHLSDLRNILIKCIFRKTEGKRI